MVMLSDVEKIMGIIGYGIECTQAKKPMQLDPYHCTLTAPGETILLN